MPSALRRATHLLLLPTLLAGCGSEAEPAPASPPAVNPTGDPLALLPREELYGASPVDNLWSPPAELEVATLPASWNGVRVAAISDLHLGTWDQNAEVAAAAVQHAVDQDPELIVLLGDYMAPGVENDVLRQVLAPLRGRAAFAVLGDRDVRTDSLRARTVSTLAEAGVHVLTNTSAPVTINGDTAYIAGLDPELAQESGADIEWVLQTVGPPGRTPLLLSHSVLLPARASTGGIGLVLAGNTFCGRVDVGVTPRLSWLREEALPGDAVEGVDRLFHRDGTTFFVTCGTGYGYVPLRFGAAPEVPIVTLVARGGDGSGAAEGDSAAVFTAADSALAAEPSPGPE